MKFTEAALLAGHIAKAEIVSRYSRSVLGSFWITLQQILFIAVISVVFPAIFRAPAETYVPFFAVSLIFWAFLSASILDGLDGLTVNAPLIKDRGFAPEIFLLTSFARNLLISAHGVVVPLALILWFGASSIAGFALALPGMVLFVATVGNLSFLSGIAGARYHDLKRLIESLLPVAFLVTPILWQPDLLPGRSAYLVSLNPLAHLFASWRQPLLEGTLPLVSLAVSAALALTTFLLALLLRPTARKIAIWI